MVSLTFKQLEAIREVARTGTIVKAAALLHVTPTALTSRIKILEEDLGLALFDRTGGRLLLTDAGAEVVATAARMDRLIGDLADTLGAMKGLHAGRVRIGAVSTAKYFTPRLLAAFLHEHPGIDFKLAIGNRMLTVASLREYEIDIALMGHPPSDFAVEGKAFGPHPHVIIASPAHPLARENRISKADLANQNFIVREQGSGTRSMFEYFFNGVILGPPKINVEIGSNETIKQAVMAGLGLSLISAHTIAAEVAEGRLAVLKVEGLPVLRQWFAIRRFDRELPPAGHALWTFIVKKGRGFLPQHESA